jgi:hypothetical protein
LYANSQYGAVFASRLVTVCLLLFSSGYAWSLDLKDVLANTAVAPPARVGFREERHNRMLKEPIVLTGYLEYPQPGVLRKVIETPAEESYLIADGQIEITQDGKTRRLSLGKSKPLQVMLGGIEAILAGQTDTLEALFNIDLSGAADDWSLDLKPKSRRIAAHLASMQVKGNENDIGSIRIDLHDGEWSMMDILQTGVEKRE